MAKQILGLKLPLRLGQDGYFETNTATIDQVSSNIRNLLLTKPGERRFNNEFGSGLYALLFQQNEVEVNPGIIVDVVQRDINKFLNGVIVDDVKVKIASTQNENTDANTIFISVVFTYNKITSTTEVELINNRI